MASNPPTQSKYPLVAERLRRKITRGALRPGDKIPSRAELQAEYNISRVTVDKVYSQLQSEGLITRHQGRGIFVSQPQPRTRTGIIGCYGFDLEFKHLSYYARLLQGIKNAAERDGYDILLLNQDSARIAWEKIDAVISAEAEVGNISKLLPPQMRCVSVLYKSSEYSSIINDDYAGTRAAVEHLISLGHRKIAYLFEHDAMTSERLRGYHDALQAGGIKPRRTWQRELAAFHRDEFRGRGRVTMQRWLKENWHKTGCTALLAQNDRTAMGVLEALREASIRVPDELSVIGFDSTEECDIVTPRLTSVRVPLVEIGRKAMELLIAEMNTESVNPHTIVMKPELQIRESVTALRDSGDKAPS